MKTRERPFERGQGCRNLFQFMRAAELLQLKRSIDGGTRAEVCNGPLQPVGRALDHLGVAGGQRAMNLVQRTRVFVQEERRRSP